MAEARPEVRVRTTDWPTSGTRQLRPSAAAAAAKAGNAGRDRVGNAERVEPPDLLAHGAPDREIAGMQTRDVLALLMSVLDIPP